MLKRGDRVRMSEALKKLYRGDCRGDIHVGPFSTLDPDCTFERLDCYGCSSVHVDEFENCIGTVEGLLDLNNCKPGDANYNVGNVGPEVEVRWQPSNLRYSYDPKYLDRVK